MTHNRLLYLNLHPVFFEFSPDHDFIGGWQIKKCEGLIPLQTLLAKGSFKPHVILLTFENLNRSEIQQIINVDQDYAQDIEWIFIFSGKIASHMATLYDALEDIAYAFETQAIPTKRLLRMISRAAKAAITTARISTINLQQVQRYHAQAYLGSSSPAQRVREMIKRLSQVPISTLLICGETGTGKGLVARALHHSGLRAQGPLVELNCAAIPHHLIESQLFGHEPGAFTDAKKRHIGLLEQADGGTLFLDEIGDLALPLQAKLLTAIEDQQFRRLGSEEVISFDAQIFAATGLNLQEAMVKGDFREDLYHRLSVFTISLPTLRERLSDLTELIPPMIVEFNEKARKKVAQVPDQVWETFMQYSWPGNVRELRNVIERCVLLSTNEELSSQWLALTSLHDTSVLQKNQAVMPSKGNNTSNNYTSDHNNGQSQSYSAAEDTTSLTFQLDGTKTLDQMIQSIIRQALILENNNITRTAKRLGVTRQTLRYRLKKYNL